MNKKKNKEEIEERVIKINNCLKEHTDYNLMKAINVLGYSKGQLKAVRTKYEYDKKKREYILKNEVEVIEKFTDESNENESNENEFNENEFNKLKMEIQDLKARIDKIEKEQIQNSKNIALTIGKYEGRLKGVAVSRQTKIYSAVNKEWTKFCRDSLYNIQDLHSLALIEFMEKYK